MSPSKDRYIWSDSDVCIVTSCTTANIYDVNDLQTSIGSWTCPDRGLFTGPVCRLDADTYLGLVRDCDLVVWSMTAQTASVRYSSPEPVRAYDLHSQYVAVLGRTGTLFLVCRQSFQVVCEHELSDRTESISMFADDCRIVCTERRSERQVQLFDMACNRYRPDTISLRRAPITARYRSHNELIIVQDDLVSLWSIPYRSSIWSVSPRSSPIAFTYLDALNSVAVLTADGVQLHPIPDRSPGLASVLGAGPRTRTLSGQAAPYLPSPDDPAEYLQVIQARATSSALDLDKHRAQIERCVAERRFSLVADLVRCAPEHIPKRLLTRLLGLDQHDIVAALLPVVTIDEDEIVQLLGAVRPDRHGPDLFQAVLSLPKTDSIVVRHLSTLTSDRVADLFSSLTSLLRWGADRDLEQIVTWICLLVDAHPITFIHHEQCRALLQQWQPVVQYMAQTGNMAERLVCLLSSYQRQDWPCTRPSVQPDFKVEYVPW